MCQLESQTFVIENTILKTKFFDKKYKSFKSI